MLGILPGLVSGDHGFEQPLYLASVEVDGEVVGCAFRTPPFNLGLSRMSANAIDPLLGDVAQVYAEIPAVMGPEDVAVPFADGWSRLRGCDASIGMRQRILAADRVTPPDPAPAGSLLAATREDLPFLLEWMQAFTRDTGGLDVDHRLRAEQLLRSESIFLWTQREARSMVAVGARTPHGARVSYVYTPAGFRGRGYATIATATLTDRLLRNERRQCFLYTDLANPTSNAIYARIGYTPVCDVVEVRFASVPGARGGQGA